MNQTQTVEAPRHPPGRGSQITSSERRTIQVDALTGGLNKTQLAQKHGRTREAINGVLAGEAYEALKVETAEDLKKEALGILVSGVVPAARFWNTAAEVAAEKGDHKPAKELLLHAGVIEPLREEGHTRGGVSVLIFGPGVSEQMRIRAMASLPCNETVIMTGMVMPGIGDQMATGAESDSRSMTVLDVGPTGDILPPVNGSRRIELQSTVLLRQRSESAETAEVTPSAGAVERPGPTTAVVLSNDRRR